MSLIVSLSAKTLTAEERRVVAHPKCFGVCFFHDNFDNRQQLHHLVVSLQACRAEAGLPPLLLLADQEGGSVQRFANDEFHRIPAAKVLGDLYDAFDEDFACYVARYQAFRLASDMRALGMHTIAPCLDRHTEHCPIIGKRGRAFHRDPAVIVKLAKAFMQTMRASGLLVFAKHFPDHGMVTVDSHVGLPVDDRPGEEITRYLLDVYQHLLPDIDVIMPAHVIYAGLDEGHVATVSRPMLQTILRQRLGFDGVLLSDDFSMAAVKTFSLEEGVAMTLEAGQDLISLAHVPAGKVFSLLHGYPSVGQASEDRLQVLRGKMQLLQQKQPIAPVLEEAVLAAYAQRADILIDQHYTTLPDKLCAVVDKHRATASFSTQTDAITGLPCRYPVQLPEMYFHHGAVKTVVREYDLSTLLALTPNSQGIRQHPMNYGLVSNYRESEGEQFTLNSLSV